MAIYCFLELAVGLAVIPGKIIIELFDSQVPKVVENFRVLCTGERGEPKYQGTTFHRIVETFTLQGGDTDKTGTGGSHIYGAETDPFVGDDMFWRNIDEEMLVCMAENPPRSQFFITLRPSPHLNGSHCCFGKVLRGQQVLQQISQLEVDGNDCPIDTVTIARCGELEYKGPQVSAKTAEPEPILPSKSEEKPSRDRALRSRERRSSSFSSQGRHKRERSREHRPPRSSRRRASRSPRRENNRERIGRNDERRHHDLDMSRYHQDHGKDNDQHRHNDHTRILTGNAVPEVIYKGRGKMVYRDQRSKDNRSGRLT